MDLTITLSVIVGVAGIITTGVLVWLANWWRNRKSLSYEIRSEFNLWASNHIGVEDLIVTFHGEPIDNLLVMLVRVINDGNQPLIASDFERPVTFTFFENTQIISADVIETNANSFFQPTLNVSGGVVTLEPSLMNPKDYADIKLVLAYSEPDEYRIDARIVGVKEFSHARPPFPRRIVVLPVISIVIAIFTSNLMLSLINASAARQAELDLPYEGNGVPKFLIFFMCLVVPFSLFFAYLEYRAWAHRK